MNIDDQTAYPVLAFLVVIAAALAFCLRAALVRLGVMPATPQKYLAHLVLLLTIAVTTMIAAGVPTLLESLTVLGGVVVIWLVAVWLSSQVTERISRKFRQ